MVKINRNYDKNMNFAQKGKVHIMNFSDEKSVYIMDFLFWTFIFKFKCRKQR